jgi:hypothetical protein
VRAAFIADVRRRFQEERAAALLAAVRGGQTLAAAAEAAGIAAEELGPFGREASAGNPMPRDLLPQVFELRGTDATMVQRPQSFAVVQLRGVTRAEPATTPPSRRCARKPADHGGRPGSAVPGGAARPRRCPDQPAPRRADRRRQLSHELHRLPRGARARRAGPAPPRARGDLDTPVGAFLKLAEGRPYASCWNPSKAARRAGRYSAIGLAPDLIWRVRDGVAECNTTPCRLRTLRAGSAAAAEALRARIRDLQMPRRHRPALHRRGLFGYLGYDMVRQMERLPGQQSGRARHSRGGADPPTLVAVFDHVRDALTLATPVWAAEDADAAWALAQQRLDDAEAALDRPLPRPAPPPRLPSPPEPRSNFTPRGPTWTPSSARATTSAPATSSRWCRASAFSVPFALPPFALYRAPAPHQPRALPHLLRLRRLRHRGASPEILVAAKDGEVTIRPLAGTRRRGATPRRTSPSKPSSSPTRRSAPST